jgi:hypothetical protein
MMRTEKHITREMLQAEPNTLFVFGDNIAQVGKAGQAREMRGEPNAAGIPTKWSPSMRLDAFFTDDQLDLVKDNIDAAFGRLFMHAACGGDIVWPEDGIGTGLAQLPRRSPAIWDYIERGRKALGWCCHERRI